MMVYYGNVFCICISNIFLAMLTIHINKKLRLFVKIRYKFCRYLQFSKHNNEIVL